MRPREATPAAVVALHVGEPNEPARVAPPPTAAPAPIPSQRPPAVATDDSAAHVRSAAKRSDGMLVIWISIGIAILIVAAGGAIAWYRHAAAETERERILQQRFDQLRHPQ